MANPVIRLGPNAAAHFEVAVGVPTTVEAAKEVIHLINLKQYIGGNPDGLEVTPADLVKMQAQTNLNDLVAAGLVVIA
jgi:hypothetical protein